VTGNGDKKNTMIEWNGLFYSHGFKIGSSQMACNPFLVSSPSPPNPQSQRSETSARKPEGHSARNGGGDILAQENEILINKNLLCFFIT
jgi:hypothetical protein